MYRNSSKHVWKVSSFDSKTSKSFVFVHENVEKNMSWIQNIRKVSHFDPNYSKSMIIVIKTFGKYSTWFWHQKIQKVFDFCSKHLTSIGYICKMFEKYREIVKKKVQKYRIWNQTIRKVCFLAQTFKKYGISTRNTRKLLDFSSEH